MMYDMSMVSEEAEAPARPPTLVDFAFSVLRDQIIRGDLAPGTQLRLQKHASLLGVSSIPLREALQRLEQAGLVRWTPHYGASVTEASIADMEDTYRVRIALEVLAIREAARSFSTDDEAAAKRWFDQYRRASSSGDTDAAREAHAQFHRALYRPAESQWLDRLIPQLWANSERYRLLALKGLGTVEQRAREHQRLLEACRSNRPDAAEEALRHHFELTQQVIRKRLAMEGTIVADDSSRVKRRAARRKGDASSGSSDVAVAASRASADAPR